ncbi:MAG: methylenetetrahydrofolate reductase [Actinomycetes bacterium]
MAATSISIELFPPKDVAGEDRLWEAMATLRQLHPDFISVTYGAGGSTRDRTVRITKELTDRTAIPTVAHLTCVGSTKAELLGTLGQYQAAGITSILALRGDPSGGPSAPWESFPGGFDHADQLVELAQAFGGFDIGVAAFPDGHPASAGNFEKDIDVLLRKEELGATFATTQFFFESARWGALVERLRSRGSHLPVIAGILPVTNVKQLKRMAELGGTPIPTHIEKRFAEVADNPQAVHAMGVELATTLSLELLELGVPGLHFYTMNSSSATMQIARNLQLDQRGPR